MEIHTTVQNGSPEDQDVRWDILGVVGLSVLTFIRVIMVICRDITLTTSIMRVSMFAIMFSLMVVERIFKKREVFIIEGLQIKMKSCIYRLFFALFLSIMLSTVGCSADDNGSLRDSARSEALQELNRYRYISSEFEFPKEYAITPVAPLIKEDGGFVVPLQHESYIDNVYATPALMMSTSICEFTSEGRLIDEVVLPLPQNSSVLCGVLTKDVFYYIATSWGKGHETWFSSYDRINNCVIEDVPFRNVGIASGLIPTDMILDWNGNIYLISEDHKSVISVDNNYEDKITFRFKGTARRLYLNEEGTVCCLISHENKLLLE